MAASAQMARLAANRFGLGIGPGDIGRIGDDPQRWLLGQIAGNAGAPPLAGIDDSASRVRYLEQFRAQRQAESVRRARDAALAGPPPADLAATAPPAPMVPDAVPPLPKPYAVMTADLLVRLRQAIASETPFLDHLTMFWTNHFTVSAARDGVAALAVPYENEAIRPHVTGSFSAMLLATARHPAMMLYLDSLQSVGPHSPNGQRAHRSYNENYAREVMELHTLGVGSGYTQADIIELALALTGWTLDRVTGAAVFRPGRHEPGPRQFLGRSVADDGAGQSDAMLRALAVDPRTARHVCARLAAYFLGDAPTETVVAAMARTWISGGGELAPVYRTMLQAAEAWAPAPVKFRSPEEFLIAAGRALQLAAQAPRLLRHLRTLAGLPFTASSPAGFDERQSHWLTPDALVQRINIAADLAGFAPADADPVRLAQAVLGTDQGGHAIDAVRRAPSAAEGFALLLASPGFQRR